MAQYGIVLPPLTAPAERADQPLDVLGLPGPLPSRIPGRRRQRLAGALRGLGFGVRDLAGTRLLALEHRLDAGELGAELGLDLLSTVELAAGAVHAAEL